MTKAHQAQFNRLNRKERRIYKSVMQSFPATSPDAAYNVAIQGGVRFQFRPA